MKNVQIIAGFLVSLLLLWTRADAQNTKSQSLAWQVDRVIQPDEVANNWEAASLKSTAPAKESPQRRAFGRNFTFNDSVKGRFGKIWATGVATQDYLKVRVESILSIKNDRDVDGYSGAGITYSLYPTFFLAGDAHLQVEVNLKSNVETSIKIDREKEQKFLQAARASSAIASAATKDEEYGIKRLMLTSDFGSKSEDSWKNDVTLTEEKSGLASKFFNVQHSFDNEKIWEGIDFLAFLGEYKQLPKAPFQVSSNAKAEDGEAYVHLVEEITITVKQNATSDSAPSIGVDFNHDGMIDYDKVDKTSAAKPFDFWLNTDCEADEEQENPPTEVQDCADGVISSTRDLEDFSRLHIQAPDGFRADGTWKCKLNFVGATGSPAIRLFPATSPGPEYLTNPDAATKQIRISSNFIVGSTPVEIPLSLFKSDGANKFRAALLFEALKAGKGALQVTFTKAGKEQKAKNPVYLNLRPIQDFYDYYTLPDFDVNNPPTSCPPPRAASPTVAKSQTSDYILFVHGWRMQEWKKQVFSETSFKRLWQRGYKGKFGFFSWPTEYVKVSGLEGAWNMLTSEDNRLNYDHSERKAWLSAEALHGLLTLLNTSNSGKVRVFAHSMGSVVTSEALLLEAESPTPQKLVHTYVATQAATVAQAYDSGVADDSLLPKLLTGNVYKSYPLTSQPYFYGTKNNGGIGASADHLVNYFNRKDYALTSRKAWPANQTTKPDNLAGYIVGLTGDSFHRGRLVDGIPTGQVLKFPSDRYEIFAHAAPAFSSALGAQSVKGVFTDEVDLGASPFNFSGDAADHSAQFNSDLMTRYPYWEQLMKSFGINVSPPK